jgi:phosphoribosyl 1,2-cyclic phosphate phosphodiesterase
MMVRRLGRPAGAQTTLVVDASPEFRLQCAGAGARRLDALLLTHDHADQCHGIDDIRAFAIKQGGMIDCWMNAATRRVIEHRFRYIFEGEGIYPSIAAIRDLPGHGVKWCVDGPSGPIEILGFDQDHGTVRSVGYRFGSVAYSSDIVNIPEESFAALEGLDVWIVDALKYAPHPTHAHVDKALEWIERVKPRRAILTNMHVDVDFETLAARLPAGVEPAYDSLRFEINIEDSGP